MVCGGLFSLAIALARAFSLTFSLPFSLAAVLGASLHDVLTRLKADPQRFPKLELVFSCESPVTDPISVVLPHDGLRLRFDGREQRLRLIEVMDFSAIDITFQDRHLLKPPSGDASSDSKSTSEAAGKSSSPVGPAFRHIYHRLLGPTYPGEYIPPSGEEDDDGVYVLSYPGVAFNFPLPASSYAPGNDVISLLSASSRHVATSMAIFNGDSWAEARPTLWTEVLPSPKPPSVGSRSKDLYPEEVSLVRLYGGGKVDMFRRWTNNVFRIRLGVTTPQDLVTHLGPPNAIYRKQDQKMIIHKMHSQARTGRYRPLATASGRPEESTTDTDRSELTSASGDSDDGANDLAAAGAAMTESGDGAAVGGPAGECFYNYFHLGFDVLLSTPVESTAPLPDRTAVTTKAEKAIKCFHPDRLVVTKLILHGNVPGSYEFNRHRRCRWEIGFRDDGKSTGVDAQGEGTAVNSEMVFTHIEERMRRNLERFYPSGGAQSRQRGMVLNRGWGTSPGSSCELLGGWEESAGSRSEAVTGESATTLYGFPGLVFEVLKNDYVNAVTVF